ncbi:hypothetical protein KP509_1Z027800 [Ceratopteris richardii]|nr:hypothetical protein KP509_1Z027800 [Ceratopteris richardii]
MSINTLLLRITNYLSSHTKISLLSMHSPSSCTSPSRSYFGAAAYTVCNKLSKAASMASMPSPSLTSILSFLCLGGSKGRPALRARVFSELSSAHIAFEVDLSEKLSKLTQKTRGEAWREGCNSDPISMDWMCQALDVVLSTQTSITQAIGSANREAYFASPQTKKIISQHMEDIVKLLDACCIIRETLSKVRSQVKAFRVALGRMRKMKPARRGYALKAKQAILLATLADKGQNIFQDDSSSPRAVRSSKRLQGCSSMLRRMGEKLPAPPARDQGQHGETEVATNLRPSIASCETLSSVLYGGEITTLFVLRFISTALSSIDNSSRYWSQPPMSPIHVSSEPIWAPCLRTLHDQLSSELLQIAHRNKNHQFGTLLPELHMLEVTLNEIYKTLRHPGLDSSWNDIEQLVTSSEDVADHMDRSISTLQRRIDQVSASLINIRKLLLDCL